MPTAPGSAPHHDARSAPAGQPVFPATARSGPRATPRRAVCAERGRRTPGPLSGPGRCGRRRAGRTPVRRPGRPGPRCGGVGGARPGDVHRDRLRGRGRAALLLLQRGGPHPRRVGLRQFDPPGHLHHVLLQHRAGLFGRGAAALPRGGGGVDAPPGPGPAQQALGHGPLHVGEDHPVARPVQQQSPVVQRRVQHRVHLLLRPPQRFPCGGVEHVGGDAPLLRGRGGRPGFRPPDPSGAVPDGPGQAEDRAPDRQGREEHGSASRRGQDGDGQQPAHGDHECGSAFQQRERDPRPGPLPAVAGAPPVRSARSTTRSGWTVARRGAPVPETGRCPVPAGPGASDSSSPVRTSRPDGVSVHRPDSGS